MTKTMLKNSIYPAVILFVLAATLAVWTYNQHLCCGMNYFWANFWLVVGVLCGGWIAGVVTLRKQGRLTGP